MLVDFLAGAPLRVIRQDSDVYLHSEDVCQFLRAFMITEGPTVQWRISQIVRQIEALATKEPA